MDKETEKLYGVGCDVINCRFHGKDSACHAESIKVKNIDAVKKAETFCGTFEVKD